jgi:hypothetical protein
VSPWKAAIAAALALLAAPAWAQSAPEPAGLEQRTFTLEKVCYRILLPKGAITMSRIDGFSALQSPRLMRRLHLAPARRIDGRSFAHVKRLRSSAVLRYKVDYNIGEGSFGTAAALEGVLEIGTRVVAVTCSDNDDLYTPRPDWCLAFLHHLEANQDAR